MRTLFLNILFLIFFNQIFANNFPKKLVGLDKKIENLYQNFDFLLFNPAEKLINNFINYLLSFGQNINLKFQSSSPNKQWEDIFENAFSKYSENQIVKGVSSQKTGDLKDMITKLKPFLFDLDWFKNKIKILNLGSREKTLIYFLVISFVTYKVGQKVEAIMKTVLKPIFYPFSFFKSFGSSEKNKKKYYFNGEIEEE